MTFEKIKTDMYAAMKSGNKLRKGVLSTIMNNAKNRAIDSGADRENISEEIVNATLLAEKTLLKKMIAEFPENATSNEHKALLENYHQRLKIVLEYAPQIIDDENEIRAMIVDSGIVLEKKNMGKIMGMLKGKKCDMGVARVVVQNMLN